MPRLDSPGTTEAAAANIMTNVVAAGTLETGVATSLAAAEEAPFATVAIKTRQMTASATAPTAWPATERSAGSGWTACWHAMTHRRSSYARTTAFEPATGLERSETCTSGTAAGAVPRGTTGAAPGTRYSAVGSATGAGLAAGAPSGLGSEAGPGKAPVEATGQLGRAIEPAESDC